MKTRIILAFLLFAGFAFRVNAQDNNAKQQQSAKDAQEYEALKNRLAQRIMETRQAHMNQKSDNVRVSQYNFREKEILEKLKGDDIPADFPVYKPEYTTEQYTILMNKWYSANPALVKTINTNEQK